MPELPVASAGLAWPLAIAIAWLAGEFGYRWTRLPRISIYGLIGFLLGNTQAGLLPPVHDGAIPLLANIAFGLILFEFGYRINLQWLRVNPWIAVTGFTESIATFAVVFVIALWLNISALSALLLASLAMSTSPAGIMRVVNEERGAGQVTERLLHLTALNCVLAILVFKVVVGYWVFRTYGSLWQAGAESGVVLLASAAAGALFGVLVPALLRRLGSLAQDATVAFAITVIVLVAVTYLTKLSPVLATLMFGLTARHRRVVLSQTQRNFGALGDLLAVLLFVFVASTLEWRTVAAGIAPAVLIIAARLATKTLGVTMLSRVSGSTWRKGLFTGFALAPMSVFVILLLEQTRHLGISVLDELAPLAACALILELIGPLITQRALIWAREAHASTET